MGREESNTQGSVENPNANAHSCIDINVCEMLKPNMFPKFNLLKAVCMCVAKRKKRRGEGGGWRGEKRLRRGRTGKGGVGEQGTTGDFYGSVERGALYRVSETNSALPLLH